MPVVIEDPQSFKVQDFLAAFAAANNNFFFMIDPIRSDNSGPAIVDTWVNSPVIGLSTHDRSKDVVLGFPTPGSKPATADDTFYEPEALLIFEVPAKNLPKGMPTDAWVIQVKDQEKVDVYLPIAKALEEKFHTDIIITPSQMKDPDPEHLSAEPVDPRFPEGPHFQPILVRTVRPA